MGNSPFLDLLKERVVIFDGATGTNLQLLGLTADDFGGPHLEGCNEILVKTRPDAIAQLHASFFEVGVDVVETNTFGAFSVVLDEYAISDQTYEINKTAAQIARRVANDFSHGGQQRFVAGSVGPGTKLPTLGQISFVELRDAFEIQMRGLLDGGIDLFIIETCYDLLEAKTAVIAARKAMAASGREVPIQLQVTIETTGRMLLGTEIGAALTALEAMRPDVFGMNCATGPREMSEHLRYLSQHCRVPVAVLPNAGLPTVVDGKMHYDLTPEELSQHHQRFITEYGVQVVGGCCGTTTEHLEKVVETCRNLTPAKRRIEYEPGATSVYSPVSFHQDTSFLVIGERTNANGSKQFRDAMLQSEWHSCEQIARDQIREGAHLLDVCVDYVGRDGQEDMNEIVKRFAGSSSVPLVLDSTEPQVMETGLQWLGGRAVLNSANLEDGEGEGSRIDRVFRLAREYGAAVICLLIDEEGQARDVEWKMRIAHRIHDLAVNHYGLEASDLLFDALTFPLSTGDENLRGDAMATIEAIKRIKTEIPGAFTVLGVSNVSFGLKPATRHVLNSVFLHECVQAGLDAAIVHASKIRPINKIDDNQKQLALDLIYDRRRDGYDPLQQMIAAFADANVIAVEEIDLSSLPIEERLKQRIIDGNRNGLEADLDEALANREALEIVNEILLEGMKVVGDLFASGEMQLPFVLQSAETMKSAVAHLEPHMEKTADGGKGRIVLATVKGDVHDIGKNLVDIILTNNGYDVYNLGIKVAINEMIEKAKEVEADAIGMSGLLVKSTLIMRDNLEELNNQGLADLPILLGGAALTRRYVERDLREVYQGRVFYGKDAFEGLTVMEQLIALKHGRLEDDTLGRVPMGRIVKEKTKNKAATPSALRHSPDVAIDNQVFTPPFLGSRVVRGVSFDEISEYVNETALFRNQWGFRPEKGESDEEFKNRIRAIFREQLALAKQQNVLIPQIVYGYYAANGDGNDLIIWSDDTRTNELTRFTFPRQQEEPWLCITDFFRSVESNEFDYAAFHIVTMGNKVSEETARRFSNNEYQDYLFLHGLGVEMTEALAELWHKRIREEWGFGGEDSPSTIGLFRQDFRGGRYSWGYPACPDLEDNSKVADLLEAERVGVTVSEGFQLHPEQTTSAIICHHPQAKYFIA